MSIYTRNLGYWVAIVVSGTLLSLALDMIDCAVIGLDGHRIEGIIETSIIERSFCWPRTTIPGEVMGIGRLQEKRIKIEHKGRH